MIRSEEVLIIITTNDKKLQRRVRVNRLRR